MHIGIFDSGVGGLSVLQSVMKLNPEFSYSYCLDQLHFPYGVKSEGEVLTVATQACYRFVNSANLDILVVACGTASTLILPELRRHLKIPVVGVVPAVKPASEQSKSKVVGVLVTKATASRPYLRGLMNEFASDCRVEVVGSSKLVELAEAKIRGVAIKIDSVREEIASFFSPENKGLDAIVLGCTHFPLLREELSLASSWDVRWIDSGEAIARRCKQLGLLYADSVSPISNGGIGYTTGDLQVLWSNEIPAFVKSLRLNEWRVLP